MRRPPPVADTANKQPAGELATEVSSETKNADDDADVRSEADTPLPSLDEAAAALQAAERDVDKWLAFAVPSAQPADASVPDAQPAPPRPGGMHGGAPVPPPTRAQPPTPRPPKPMASQAQRCSRACSALSSMDRSAARICELVGNDEDRCGAALLRATDARARVERACPSCRQG